jgi:hypothetical protein
MKLKKLIVLATTVTLSLSATIGFSAYKVYSEPNNSSKVLTEINNNNASNFLQFYKTKDGSWQKLANTQTGQVGWVNIKDIRKHKADIIKQRMLKNIDKNITYYQNEINDLKKLKTKVSVADLKKLRKMQRPINIFNEMRSNNDINLYSGSLIEPHSYSFSKSYSYTGGKNANVTETITKNGKKETKDYEIPVTQAN